MKKLSLIILALMLTLHPARADQAEAKEVARINNCPPKKIEVYQAQMSGDNRIIYQVTCNLPKMVGEEGKGGPDALLVSCADTLCEVLRPITLEKK